MRRFSVSDIARETGVSAHTLRYYERIGLLPEVERAASSGHRRYHERHVHWIRFLRRLRSAGMPIATMRRYVALAQAGDASRPERMAILEAHRNEVARQIEELQAHLDVLDRKLKTGCSPRREEEAEEPRSRRGARRSQT